MSSQAAASSSQSIAVIGIGCRFPGGVSSPEAFWRLLLDNVDTVGEIPADLGLDNFAVFRRANGLPALTVNWGAIADVGPSHEHPEGFRQLVIAASADQQVKLVTARLSERLALVLGSSVAKIDPERSTADLGLGSFMAMEFRLRIEKDLGIDIPVMQLMHARSLADLALYLVEQLTGTSVSGQEVIMR